MHRFLRGLRQDLESVRSNILGDKELPPFAQVFSCISRALRGSNSGSIHAKSAFVSHSKSDDASPLSAPIHGGFLGGGDRGGFRGCGDCGGFCSQEHEGNRSCAYGEKDNYTRGYCWNLFGRPLCVANTNTLRHDTNYTVGRAEQSRILISGNEYSQFLQYQNARKVSTSIVSLAYAGLPITCFSSNSRSSEPWVMSCGATDHMSNAYSLFSYMHYSSFFF